MLSVTMNDAPINDVPAHYEEILNSSRDIGFGMPSDMQTGRLLRALASSKPGGTFLEIGTGTGLGAAWILGGMDESSTLVSVESNPDYQGIASRYLAYDRRLDLVLDDGIRFLETAESLKFEFIYADAIPGKYVGFDHSLRILKRGGILVLDDMLPQPNWPEGHPAKVESLLKRIDGLAPDSFSTVKLCWYTGHILIAKK